MKKLILVAFATAFFACNSPEQNSTTGNTEDSVTVGKDTTGGMRGETGTGVDNTGGTPGAGTLTDTTHGSTDTLNHTSQKK